VICKNSGCKRPARLEDGTCCGECINREHTVNCHLIMNKDYLATARFPQHEEDDLIGKLKRNIALMNLLEKDFKQIRGASLMLGVEWGATLESLLAHLEIDLRYIEAEVKKITGV
jgi:hypothetical protein